VNEVGAILGQPSEDTAILLRYMRWNKERLIERYMEEPEKLQDAAGVESDVSSAFQTQLSRNFTCNICCEDDGEIETYALKCGHRYCADCYRHYLASKIKDEGEAARIQCPTSKCNRIVDARSLNLLVEASLKDRYVYYSASMERR
jgi:ariadne-1